jgi:putative exosortase-associated protein (TIGR04073 family)
MGYKFGRGAVNVLTCWTEIPRNVALEWQRTDPASGFFLGVGKGLGYGYTRFVGGVYDMVTFAFPVPMGFAPVMDPEFSVYNEYREAPSGRLTVEPLDVATADESEEPATRYSAQSKRQWP